MALSTNQFRDQLIASGLMTAEELSSLLVSLPHDNRPTDGEQLARELVRQKKLTKFQAEQIYAGKGASLTLGNYVILDKLGQGGMGVVLKAEHKRMKRLVALKVMSPAGMKSPDAVKRFHREVEAAAKLRHPNIVAADDADEAKGTHFLVMEYVEGTDLSAFVKKHGPMPVELAVQCILQAARGLEFAHSQGVIHRDIKPANLLMKVVGGPLSVAMDSNGPRTTDHGLTVKILDMGLARIDGAVGGSSEGAGLTSTGTIMGTVDYMSPEQAMDTKHADARSDIYSLGCSLYYLLTGKCLYDGDTMMKKLMAHQNAPVPELSSPHVPREEPLGADSRTTMSGDLDANSERLVTRNVTATLAALNSVFRRMVAKRPEDRPQSMTAVIAELERCLAGGPATVIYHPSGSSATNIAESGAAGSGNELQDFLRQISGGEPVTATSGKGSGTAVTPSSGEAETMISSADGAGTDPRTEQTLTLDRSGEPMGVRPRTVRGPTPAGSPKRKWKWLIGSIAAGVVVLLAIAFAMRGHSGTLILEINDELIKVTLGETGRTVQGKTKHTLQVPLGELFLHIQREDLSFNTDPFDIPKGKPVTIKVERVGRRVHAMQGTTLLGHNEEPKSKSDATPVASNSAWKATTQQQAFLDAVAKMSADEQVEAVKKKLIEVNPGFDGKVKADKAGPKVVGLTITEAPNFWPVRALPDLKILKCGGSGAHSKVSDLTALSGLPLADLTLGSTAVSDLTPLKGMPLTSLYVGYTHVTDLSPLKGMRLTSLSCYSTKVSDLTPLAGMPLEVLDISFSKVKDLNPLRSMPLKTLICHKSEISDLTPLIGMLLTKLEVSGTHVADLKALANMPLQRLSVQGTAVSDLTPLAGMPLTSLDCDDTAIFDLAALVGSPISDLQFSGTSVSDLTPLSKLPLNFVNLDVPLFHEPDEKLVRSLPASHLRDYSTPPDKFWQDYSARKQAAEEFATATAKLPPDEQVTAISRRFQELKQTGVGFKPTITDNTIVEVTLTIDEKVTDITPLRALSGLKKLTINGGPHWLDLSPLNSTPLESLTCRELIARRNAHILKAISKLTKIEARPEPNAAATPLPNGPPPPAVAPFDAKQARTHQEEWAKHLGTTVETTNSVGAKMVLIPPGEFRMGNPSQSVDVKLTQPFWLGKYEITQAEYRAVMNDNPSLFCATGMKKELVAGLNTDQFPVEGVTWDEAVEFCRKLTQRETQAGRLPDGWEYRLPTEAQWEYACRAGTRTLFSFGDSAVNFAEYGWCVANAEGLPHDVGQKRPNSWGLHDMHGNVWEWCRDWYAERLTGGTDPEVSMPHTRRVDRGGCWFGPSADTQSGFRNGGTPETRIGALGFRVALVNTGAATTASSTGLGRFDWSSWSANPPKSAVAPFDAQQARAHQEAWAKHLGVPVEYTNPIRMKMVLIPPGEFWMGSPDDEINAVIEAFEKLKWNTDVPKRESPRQRVTISEPFFISATELTRGQFRQFAEQTSYKTDAERGSGGTVNENGQFVRKSSVNWRDPGIPFAPSGSDQSDDVPVLQVTWNDASEFCRWLSDFEQAIPAEKRTAAQIPVAYSLPSEAQWEYACRAGTETPFWYGDLQAKGTDEAVLPGGSVNAISVVARKRPNPFGLYDMHGNAGEWCFDDLTSNYKAFSAVDPVTPPISTSRIVRGGTVFNSSLLGRSASRGGAIFDVPMYSSTFRVIRKLTGLTALRANGLNPAPPPAVAPFDAAKARAHQEAWARHLGTAVETTNSVGAKMVLIPPGEFLMGSTDEQVAAARRMAEAAGLNSNDLFFRQLSGEQPQHRVILERPFLLGQTEVTVGQFRRFIEASKSETEAERYGSGNNGETTLNDNVKPNDKGKNWKSPGYAITDDFPVSQITWNDACAFCVWLSEQEGLSSCYRSDGKGGWSLVSGANGYRLPSEAEWEFACRAGTLSQFSWGDDEREAARFGAVRPDSGKSQALPAGGKLPNPFGLFDLHGNMREWCHDNHSLQEYAARERLNPFGPLAGTSRVQRGGDWSNPAVFARSSTRSSNGPSTRYYFTGFRVVRGLDAAVSTADRLWTDWLGPKLAQGAFAAEHRVRQGWQVEGNALTTKTEIMGEAVLPSTTRDGAVRLTYLLRDAKGIQINARDRNSGERRELYVAEDNGTTLSISRVQTGSPNNTLVKRDIPATVAKDAPRTLEFRVVGDTLTATLNGSVVATVKDSTITEGNFAMVALKRVLIQKVEYQSLDEPK